MKKTNYLLLLVSTILLVSCNRSYEHIDENAFIDSNIFIGYRMIQFVTNQTDIVTSISPSTDDGYVYTSLGYGCFEILPDTYRATAKIEVVNTSDVVTYSSEVSIDSFFIEENLASIDWNEAKQFYDGTYMYHHEIFSFDHFEFNKLIDAKDIIFSIKIFNDNNVLYDLSSTSTLIYSDNTITGYSSDLFS